MTDAGVIDAEARRDAYRMLAASVGRSIAWIVLLVTVYFAVPTMGASTIDIVILAALGLAVVVLVVALQVRASIRSARPLTRVIESVAVVATLLVVVFATTYRALSHRDPAAFSESLDHVGALYFTLTTLATVGYGDVSPRSDAARIVVMLQIVANVVVLGVAVKVLFGVARRRGRPVWAAHTSSSSDDPGDRVA